MSIFRDKNFITFLADYKNIESNLSDDVCYSILSHAEEQLRYLIEV